MIGIAGGIGCGKSVVSRILRLKGYTVYDCDFMARKIMDDSESIKTDLIGLFGKEAVKENTIDRKHIASIVFNDGSMLRQLNETVHRHVLEDLRRWRESVDSPCFVESAILASSGIASLCDSVWLVTASDETRIKRVVIRNNLSREEIMTRMEIQRGEEALPRGKVSTINNDDDDSLLDRIEELLNIHQQQTINNHN